MKIADVFKLFIPQRTHPVHFRIHTITCSIYVLILFFRRVGTKKSLALQISRWLYARERQYSWCEVNGADQAFVALSGVFFTGETDDKRNFKPPVIEFSFEKRKPIAMIAPKKDYSVF